MRHQPIRERPFLTCSSKQNQLHVHIGSSVGRGNDAVGIDMLEAEGLIEVNGGRQYVIGFKIESVRASTAPLFDHRLKQSAANAGALVRRLDSHLGHLKFSLAGANQCAAADASFPGSGKENSPARVENIFLRVGKN